MDIGVPLKTYGLVDIEPLREAMEKLPYSYWESDRDSRVSLAGDRPGNAVFLYNDKPANVMRKTLFEARSGYVNVMRYADRPLIDLVDDIIEKYIQPEFPNCDPMRVQLAELPPGQVITPHRDMGILAAIHRTHVPIVTDPGVKFIIQRQAYFLEPGRLYDLNNVVVHSVENQSDVMRVHLMVDMLPHSIARCRYHETEAAMLEAAVPVSA
ncbi:aspartyl/asparaginyl beta-hydroxylase domain-containing protein [Oricola sp.]|uniref:aspartyl/asparaginyl beta-hydroxylase domain-containing protein n=1 Tax=Oricola sp. TaxID=1979950 RepID=UPI0025F6A659|nr:aspartyl/asparaginyl beta-hydroxylase domain-containing protein [Oricola sp.]MCI5076132.1 aspartyl/asparaginyl beta-hydroxylase domain-containing protein [Oricola sp.]